MTAHHLYHRPIEQTALLSSAIALFLNQNQTALVTVLRLIGQHEAANRVAALPIGMQLSPTRIDQILADLSEAKRCLEEAPVQLDGVASLGWSDFDAALRWMGARLTELVQPVTRRDF